MASLRSPDAHAEKCSLPFLGPNGDIVFFDIESAEPGNFTVPGVVDLETYEPGTLIETSWVFFKGDPMAGPQPDHPFEMPFNNSAKWSLDLVRNDENSTPLREIMPPTNASLFWEGGAPFGTNGNHSMQIPQIDRSCKFYSIGLMLYRWTAPKDVEEDEVFRLKLTTDVPPTTHLSGKLTFSHADAATSSIMAMEDSAHAGFLTGHAASVVLLGVCSVAMIWWVFVRLRRRSRRIVLA